MTMNHSSSENTATKEVSRIASPIAGIFDFSDRLSPMFVKELRQGLQGRAFMSVFLLLHLFLAIILSGAVSDGSSDSGETVSSLVLRLFALSVMVVQPLRGINAISAEIKGNTLSLVLLTRLSAWRIVTGKWISIVTQSTLILLSILPYLFLRYFLGGMNLVQEVVLYGFVFVAGAALCAVTVGLSSIASIIVRGLISIMGIVALSSAILNIELYDFAFLFGGGQSILYMSTAIVVGLSVYISWLFLDMGASMIAPISENRATKRRIISFLTLVVTVGTLLLLGYFEAAFISCMIIVFPMLFFLMNEPYELVPVVCLPFVKKGALGRLAGKILYPGWHTGVWFLTLPLGVFFYLLYSEGSFFGSTINTEAIFIFQSLLGCILFPAVINLCFFEKKRPHFGFYLLILAISGLFASVCNIVAESIEDDSFLNILSLIPPVQFVNYEYNWSRDYSGLGRSEIPQLLSTFVVALYWGLLLILSVLRRKRTVIAEEEAIKMLGGSSK